MHRIRALPILRRSARTLYRPTQLSSSSWVITRKEHGAVLPPQPGVNETSVVDFIYEKWPDVPCKDLKCLEVSRSGALLTSTVPERDVRPGGFISGPYQFAMADVAMWVAVFGAKGLQEMAMTSDLSIKFLRPAAGRTIHARVQMIDEGRRNLNMSAIMWTNDQKKPTSIANGTYVMPR